MTAVLSSLIADEFSRKTNIDVIALKPYDLLDAPVGTHADMLICKIEDTVFTFKDYYYNNVELFLKIKEKYKVVLVEGCKRGFGLRQGKRLYPDKREAGVQRLLLFGC